MKYINKICEWQLFSTCTQLIYENVGNIQKKIKPLEQPYIHMYKYQYSLFYKDGYLLYLMPD